MKTYDVNVMRTGWGYKTIRVEGDNEDDATRTAMDCAGDEYFTESDSDYAFVDIAEVPPPPPPKPPMHELVVKHLFKPGDIVFVQDGDKVSRQTVGRVQVNLDAGGLSVCYVFYGLRNSTPFHAGYVFATAEEAFQ